ncbi:MAG: hypothetical protein ACO3XO_07830 [Bdellovibrionota bacterium]|jgi:hypothetical protein
MATGNKTSIGLEAALMRVVQLLDTQVAREMQRTPIEREQRGVQKWEPYRSRGERISSLLLEGITEGELQLDGLLILSEAIPRCLRILAEELGEDGLGKIRSSYVKEVFVNLEREIHLGQRALGVRDGEPQIN